MVVAPKASIVSLETISTGEAPSVALPLMKEPVTTTSSTASSCASTANRLSSTSSSCASTAVRLSSTIPSCASTAIRLSATSSSPGFLPSLGLVHTVDGVLGPALRRGPQKRY